MAQVTDMRIPTLADIRRAQETLADHLRPTLLRAAPGLSEMVGADIWVKHENHQPTGAFKVRGGLNLMANLSHDERVAGVISASTGNHGGSVAYSARAFDVQATICVPEDANPVKVSAMEAFGAKIIAHGRDFDDAREHCEQLAVEHGYRYVHSGNEPHLISGVGTATLEILDDLPDVDAIVVPVGGGSGAAAACIAAKTVRPEIEVFGVQSSAAPAAHRSWSERRLVTTDEMNTFAEGLQTRTAFELPQRIMWALLDDFVLVSDDDIRAAMVSMIEHTRNLIESAGAATLAGALELRDRLRGKKVVLIGSGGNVSVPQLKEVLGATA